MKKKLIAMMLATTLIGGVGATTQVSAIEGLNQKAIAQEISYEGEEDKLSNNNQEEVVEEENKSVGTGDTEVSQDNSRRVGIVAIVCGSIQDMFNDLKDFIISIIGGIKPVDPDNSGDNTEDNVGDNTGDNNQQDNEIVKPEETPDNNGGTTGGENNTPDVEIPPVEEEKPTPPAVNPPVVTPPSQEDTTQKPVDSDKFMAQVEQMIYEKVNAERAKVGMSALSYDNTMQKYARIKSADMGDRGYFDHKDPEGNLITAQMKKDGVSYRAWGENIAYISGMTDATALANKFMTNWMNSPGHRANILSNNFSGIGVGVYKIGNKVYATQEFYR